MVVKLDHFRQLGSVSPLKVEVRKKCKRAVVVDTNTSVPSLRRHLKLHGGEKCWSLTIALHWSLVKPVHFQQFGSCKQAVSPHYHFSLVLLVDHSLALKRPLQTGKQANRPSSHYADTNPFLIVQPHKTAPTTNPPHPLGTPGKPPSPPPNMRRTPHSPSYHQANPPSPPSYMAPGKHHISTPI